MIVQFLFLRVKIWNNIFIMKHRLRANRNNHVIRYSEIPLTSSTAHSKRLSAESFDIFGSSMMDVQRSVKKVSILTRMQNRDKNKQKRSLINLSSTQPKNNRIEQLDKTDNFKKLRKIYLRQQQQVQKAINYKQQELQRPRTKQQAETAIKQGLLGQRRHYEKMSKDELIQKLIALEYVAKKLYKQNKILLQKTQGFIE